ncbi:MAG: VWA domain-containing protein [Thiohalocapsa sp.]|jgi:Ca-activated chloride channel family protein|uniref:vWA domain-containing protein n=1 Tax=Thiohalocapsa sp. TaxID=2497641 RepID=UPI0025F4E971|nr:VWA domain-containing protein [Thiohalocapsa sp.]MCG6943384.1 VWA domain-containing protein [Thiohalocapsa sp.]
MPADFHFLHPGWFLALLPLALLLVALVRVRSGAGAWQRVIEPQLLAALTVGADGRRRRWLPALLGLGWLVAVLALADPTFERVQVPAFHDAAARVVVLDLSQSMLADDLAPSRLERARFKVEDILRRADRGQVGLVAFAGDAFTVAPLTDDADTIRGMLSALSPEVMPVPGSRPDLAIGRAQELLHQAGVRGGEVVLITDDAGGARARAAAAGLRRAGHRLSVIGVGTQKGAAVPGVRTSRGAVIARLDTSALRSLARAGGGEYAPITADDGDLRQVLRGDAMGQVRRDDHPQQAEIWKELGPWIALALVPLAALGFRRGWLMLPVLVALNLSATAPAPALAQQVDAPAPAPSPAATGGLAQRWHDLWQRRDQQAASALERGAFDRARDVADDPARAGAARYRLGDYEAAADAFAGGGTADDAYNLGNALARAGRLEDALAAYDAALARQPDMPDALYNRKRVEEALRRRQQQPQQQSQGQQSQQSDRQQSEQQSSQGQSGQQPSPGADGGQADSGANQEQDRQQEQQGQQQAGAQHDSPGAQGGQSATQDDTQKAGDDASPSAQGKQAQPDAAQQQQRAGSASGDDNGQDAQPDDEAAAQAEQRRASEAQAAEDYRAEAGAAGAHGGQAKESPEQAAAAGSSAEAPDTAALESRQAADQWLRRIPDDPAGLLRRKFLYQYRMRAEDGRGGPPENPW